ncbi:hypothetical protein BUALT_Bualt08G0048600 [Buddleja alternifolia]|uniref:Uncharacterized protein n=1 Tax=Buddleja alternifolia TaxID=168488 RepID=A0AAV6XAZ8_9LAMI|nr:hypothetical protein BUALT_Bualt08G0048600 [Buddleja alternifolia]
MMEIYRTRSWNNPPVKVNFKETKPIDKMPIDPYKYPPCKVKGCPKDDKERWPELLGKSTEEAKATIHRENPKVTAVLVPVGERVWPNFCCNRVWVFFDGQYKVTSVPTVG